MNPWKTLKALFLPKRRLANDDAAKLTPGGLLGGLEWVASRAECQYRREDLRALPARKRVQAARLAVVRHRPAATALAATAWTDGILHIWFWLEPMPASGADLRWVPESLLLAPPAEDGVRLLALARGVEAQHWKGGILSASQWWPQLPEGEQWLRFLRACGMDAETMPQPPQPEQRPWLAAPWGETSWSQRLATGFSERMAWLLLLAVLAAGIGWQLGALWRWQAASDQMAARVERMRGNVAPLLAAREQAERAGDALGRLQALRPVASDFELMADVIRRLPKETTLASWKRESGKLVANVHATESDPRVFVEAFEGDANLADVAVVPMTGGMQLTFELPVADAAAGDAADAEGAP